MTTYLRVGRGRWPSKPPKGNPSPGCTEPLEYGANVLLDPGAELESTETTRTVGDSLAAWTATTDFQGWAQNSPGAATEWTLQNDNPRSGTFCLKATRTAGSTSTSRSDLAAVRQECPSDVGSVHLKQHRCEAGDTVTFRVWVDSSWATSTQPEFDLFIRFNDSDGSPLAGAGSNQNNLFPSGYTEFTVSAVAPSGTHTILPNMVLDIPGESGSIELWIDDAELEIVAA